MGSSTSELKFKSMLVEVFRVVLIVDAPVFALLLLLTGLGHGHRQIMVYACILGCDHSFGDGVRYVGCYDDVLCTADSPARLGGVALRGVTHV